MKKNKVTFFSPSENRCLLASTLKPEEREFVVDSEASMRMISKKDLNSAGLETLTSSKCATTVITANGEVQTHEEATVYVKELDMFLTMKVLGNTPAVLSLGKLCVKKRILLWMDQQSKTTSHKKRDSDTMHHGELRFDRGSRLVNEFFLRFSFNFKDTFKTEEASSNIFLKLVFFTDYDSIKRQWDSRKRGSKWNLFTSSARVRTKCWSDDRTERPTRCLLPNLAALRSQPKI